MMGEPQAACEPAPTAAWPHSERPLPHHAEHSSSGLRRRPAHIGPARRGVHLLDQVAQLAAPGAVGGGAGHVSSNAPATTAHGARQRRGGAGQEEPGPQQQRGGSFCTPSPRCMPSCKQHRRRQPPHAAWSRPCTPRSTALPAWWPSRPPALPPTGAWHPSMCTSAPRPWAPAPAACTLPAGGARPAAQMGVEW